MDRGRKTMKLKIKLLKGGDFEMEIDAAKKVRHPERRSHASPSRAAALYCRAIEAPRCGGRCRSSRRPSRRPRT